MIKSNEDVTSLFPWQPGMSSAHVFPSGGVGNTHTHTHFYIPSWEKKSTLSYFIRWEKPVFNHKEVNKP